MERDMLEEMESDPFLELDGVVEAGAGTAKIWLREYSETNSRWSDGLRWGRKKRKIREF